MHQKQIEGLRVPISCERNVSRSIGKEKIHQQKKTIGKENMLILNIRRMKYVTNRH